MPAFIKTPADEKRWSKAKAAVSKQKGKSADSFEDGDWALVNHIYQQMKKSEDEAQLEATDANQSVPGAPVAGDSGDPDLSKTAQVGHALSSPNLVGGAAGGAKLGRFPAPDPLSPEKTDGSPEFKKLGNQQGSELDAEEDKHFWNEYDGEVIDPRNLNPHAERIVKPRKHQKDPKQALDESIKQLDKAEQAVLDLFKGAMQRLAPFNPEKDVSTKEGAKLNTWQTYGNDGDMELTHRYGVQGVRERLDPMHPNARMRALAWLSKKTAVRTNAKGEREFLLHRGMSKEEFEQNHIKGEKAGHISHKSNRTSWTTNLETASNFKDPMWSLDGDENHEMADELKDKGEGRTVSAWINERHIFHVPRMYGALSGMHSSSGDRPEPSQNEYANENEVIVAKGHKSRIASTADIKAAHEAQNPPEKPTDLHGMINERAAAQRNKRFEEKGSAHPHAYPWHDKEEVHKILYRNRERMAGIRKSDLPHIDGMLPNHAGNAIEAQKQAMEPKAETTHQPKNDQAAGAGVATYKDIASHYGTITPGKKTDLKFYNYAQYEPHIDKMIADAGYKTYIAGMGGRYPKPDLKNKNFNTGHLMIWDPSPGEGGDFQDEAETRSWRKIHELSHALTYRQLNDKYGEGRRIGKLGTRTVHEAKRAVEWEWLAAHKQRELSEQMGVKIPDEQFHKELNTVMHDAVHRAIHGKFTEPSDEGFSPHAKKISLEHAHAMIDQHAQVIGLQNADGSAKTEGDTIHKNEVLAKEQWGNVESDNQENPIHGWISPEGKYHHMDSDDVHHEVLLQLTKKKKPFSEFQREHGPDANIKFDEHRNRTVAESLKGGWLQVGSAGQPHVIGDSRVLENKAHPAVRTLRQLIGNAQKDPTNRAGYWHTHMEVAHSDKRPVQNGEQHPGAPHVAYVDAEHFAKHGVYAPPKDFDKSVRSPRRGHTIQQLERLKESGYHNPDTGLELSPEEAEEHLNKLRQNKADKQVASHMKKLRLAVSGDNPAASTDGPDAWEGIFDKVKKSEGEVVDTDTVARHWQSVENTGEDLDTYHDLLARHGHKEYKLTDIPVDSVKAHHAGYGDDSKEMVSDYAERGTPPPAIIVKPHPRRAGLFQTIDGQHRLKAAKLKGKTHIKAYVAIDRLNKSEAELMAIEAMDALDLIKAREDKLLAPEQRRQFRRERRKFSGFDPLNNTTSAPGVSEQGIEARRGTEGNREYGRVFEDRSKHMATAKDMARTTLNQIKETQKPNLPQFDDPWDQAKYDRGGEAAIREIHSDPEHNKKDEAGQKSHKEIPDDGFKKSVSSGPKTDKEIHEQVKASLPEYPEEQGVNFVEKHNGETDTQARSWLKQNNLVNMFRSYKHTPHQPDSVMLKYLVNRIENRDKYSKMDSKAQREHDQKWLEFHQQGGAGDKNGHLGVDDLHYFIHNNHELVPRMLSHQRSLHKFIERHNPHRVMTDGEGTKKIPLTRGLSTATPGPEHQLHSYADIPDPGFGSHKHHRWVPLNNVWYSYDVGHEGASSAKYGPENEFLVSPHEIQKAQPHEVRKLVPKSMYSHKMTDPATKMKFYMENGHPNVKKKDLHDYIDTWADKKDEKGNVISGHEPSGNEIKGIINSPNADEETISHILKTGSPRVASYTIDEADQAGKLTDKHIEQAMTDKRKGFGGNAMVQNAVMRSKALKGETAEKFLHHPEGHVRAFMIRNRPDLVDQKHLSAASNDKDKEVQKAVLEHPEHTREHFENVLNQAIKDERHTDLPDIFTSKHANPDDALDALKHTKGAARNDFLRELITKHGHAVDERVINHGLASKDSGIRRRAAEHENATTPNLINALQTKDVYAQQAVMERKDLTAPVLKEALKHHDKNGWNDHIPRMAAGHQNATKEVLDEAMKNESPRVRATAIGHENATEEHIRQGLKDPEFVVQEAAVTHPKAPIDVLEAGLKHKSSDVRVSALRNPNVGLRHLQHAMTDENEGVRYEARNHPTMKKFIQAEARKKAQAAKKTKEADPNQLSLFDKSEGSFGMAVLDEISDLVLKVQRNDDIIEKALQKISDLVKSSEPENK